VRNPRIRIVHDAAALARAGAEEFARRAAEAVASGGRFCVALSGGSTPRALYSLLAGDEALRGRVPWEKIHFFWGDERPVPPDHPDSNYRMAREAMLSKVPAPPGNVHRIEGEHPAAAAAAEYEEVLRDFFRPPPGGFPSFDLALLGLGPDAHTASLFPGSPALSETRRWVVANRVERLATDRITLTAPLLNSTAAVIFLVSGDEKASALKEVLEGPHDPSRLPAQMIHPRRGTLLWLVDRAASRLLARVESHPEATRL
jgi:6-phosphogluconolactonase